MVHEVRDVDKALAKTAAGFKASMKKRRAASTSSASQKQKIVVGRPQHTSLPRVNWQSVKQNKTPGVFARGSRFLWH